MAKVLSGSFNTTKYSDRYLVFSWSATQDISKNQSTISWTLKGAGGTTTSYYMSAPFSVTIAGEEVYKSTTRIQLKNGTVVASGTKTISHNTDGTKSFSASVKAAIYYSAYNVSGSGTWDLKDIPRAATITSAPNFDDETNPVMKYSNPAGSNATIQVGLYWDSSATSALVSYQSASNATSGTHSFTLTNAQKNAIYSKLSNTTSKTIYYCIKTTIGSNTFTSKKAATVKIVNATPTISSATVVDIGGDSTQLTGNGNTMIKGFNVISASMSAAALKGATIKSYKITCGGNTINAASGNFVNVESNEFVFTVVDSRGNSSQPVKRTLTMIDYVKLSGAADISMAVSGSDSTLADLKIIFNGNYFNGSFGAKSNSLRFEIYEEQVETGLNHTDEGTIPASAISGNTYNYTHEEKGFPYESTWKIQVKIMDAINTITLPVKIVSAQPVFDWSGEDFNFNVPIHYQGKAIDFVVEQGTKDGWYYRNWKSGYGEAWKTITVNTAINTAWGTMYGGSTKMSRQTYPFPFADKPVEQATLQTASNPAWLIPESTGNGVNGAYASAIYNVVKHTTASATDYYISLYVCGKLLNS